MRIRSRTAVMGSIDQHIQILINIKKQGNIISKTNNFSPILITGA